jgi:dihydroorotate dehydrogenase (NAD+) catalytic subunit
LKNVVNHGAGGVTTKSIWLNEHIGHPGPVMIANEHYMINAVGLPDAGIEKAKLEIGHYLAGRNITVHVEGGAEENGLGAGVGSIAGVPGWVEYAPIIASIVAGKVDDYAAVAEQVSALGPDMIEINISCPNVEDQFGKPFACSVVDAGRVTKVVREKTKLPIVVKLSPNVPNIAEIARAVVDAGADGICAINTVGPGMVIDLETRQPILANKVGGISGPVIKPIAIKAVYDIHKALPATPIIGTGGVLTGEDAIEMIMAGATLVGVGTAVYYRDVACFGLIAQEMKSWCEKHGVKDLSEIRGSVK